MKGYPNLPSQSKEKEALVEQRAARDAHLWHDRPNMCWLKRPAVA